MLDICKLRELRQPSQCNASDLAVTVFGNDDLRNVLFVESFGDQDQFLDVPFFYDLVPASLLAAGSFRKVWIVSLDDLFRPKVGIAVKRAHLLVALSETHQRG